MPDAPTNPHGLGIDHLLFLVESLDRAASDMQRLGFTVTPRGTHSEHLGTANHTIVFEQDYLELIAVLTPTPHNEIHRDNLRRGEGCHTAAITTDSVDGTRVALAAAGIVTAEPVAFSRPVKLPDGQVSEAAFEVVRPLRDALPNGFMFFCNHRTPRTVWVREWMKHKNTARRIAAVVIESAEPLKTAAIYRPLFANGRQREVTGGVRLATGKADLEFMSADSIRARYGKASVANAGSPFFKVVRIGVDDIAETRSILQRNSVPFTEGDAGSLEVSPIHACGTVMEFVEEEEQNREAQLGG
ncbi:MAG: VOC family protein [Bradyrhizobiaceae bacterium]|nr:VOC family protein [Bradyrhizobiaceae bacterium]